MDVLEILDGVVEGTLGTVEIDSFDLNDEEEKKRYEELIKDIEETYEVIAKIEKDGSWGYYEIILYERKTAHSPSEDEPTWILVSKSANDTGDWIAVVFGIF